MPIAPIMFLGKSYVGAHVRRLKNGKVITVGPYYDKRIKKGTEHVQAAHGQDVSGLDQGRRDKLEQMHKEQHLLHHYHGHALRKRIAEHQAEIQSLTDQAKAHRAAGREVEATKAVNRALRHKSAMQRHARELAQVDAKVAGIGAMKDKMVAGSGAVGESTDEGHDVYAEKLGDRWKKPLEGGKPVIVRADHYAEVPAWAKHQLDAAERNEENGLSQDANILLNQWRLSGDLAFGAGLPGYAEAAVALVTGRVPPIERSIKAKILLTDIGDQLAQQPVVPQPNKVLSAKTPEKKLAVVEMSAGKKDIRYYLNGTLLDKKNRRIAATDGHRAFILNDAPVDELMQQYADPPAGDAILRYRAARVKEQKALDSFRGPNGEPPKAKPWVNGKYPDLDRVVPRDMPKNSVVVDANTLAATLNGMLRSGRHLGLPTFYGVGLETPGDSRGVMPRYLLDAANQFRALGYDRFSLGFGELPTQPIVARSLDGKASAVIMPIAGDSVFQPIRLADHVK